MYILIKNNKIMRTIYFLLLLSLTVVSNAQELDKFKKLDTIYIKFKKKKTENRIIFPKDENELIVRHYDFESNNNEKIKITFYHGISRVKGNQRFNDEFKHFFVKKEFLEKNSSKTINSFFFKRYDACKIFLEVLNPKKVIYIIDYTECKKGKVPVYEVYPWAMCNFED
jgi:hypothetical protein